jgi:hypothetical protein
VPHVAVLDADPPVAGHPAAQRRRRAGQVHILVADLAGHLHSPGRGLVPVMVGHEGSDPIEEPRYLGQGRIPGGRVIPVRIQRGLQAGGGQLRYPACSVRRRTAPVPHHRAGFVDGLPARRGRRRAYPGQPGGRGLLPPWQGGLVFAARAAVIASAGTVVTARMDIT